MNLADNDVQDNFNIKRGKPEEVIGCQLIIIEKNEMKLKIVEEKAVKDKIEKKNGKELDKNKSNF